MRHVQAVSISGTVWISEWMPRDYCLLSQSLNHPWQTRGIHPMLFQCGPASKTVGQHWNSIGWMPRVCWEAFSGLLFNVRNYQTPDIYAMLVQCCLTNTSHYSSNVLLMSARRRRRCASIRPTMDERLLITGCLVTVRNKTNTRYSPNVSPASGPTLNQHWVNAWCLLDCALSVRVLW